MVTPEHRADVHEDRRPQPELARARAERNLELGAAEVVVLAAERIVGTSGCGRSITGCRRLHRRRSDWRSTRGPTPRMSKPRICGSPRKKRSVRRTSSTPGPRFSKRLIAPPSPASEKMNPLPSGQYCAALAAQAGVSRPIRRARRNRRVDRRRAAARRPQRGCRACRRPARAPRIELVRLPSASHR